jgi:hypothetical protein
MGGRRFPPDTLPPRDGQEPPAHHDARREFPLSRQATRTWLGPSSFSVLPDQLVGVADTLAFPLQPEQVGSWLLRIQPSMELSEIVSLWRTPATIDAVYALFRELSAIPVPSFRHGSGDRSMRVRTDP